LPNNAVSFYAKSMVNCFKKNYEEQTMNISKANLQKAVKANIITSKQAEQLAAFINNQPDKSPSFNLTHVLYYLGGLVAIGAMTLFMNLGWERFGGWGLVYISIGYALIGLGLTHRFDRRGYFIPAGICATFVVALTPLALYGFQKAMGFWPDDTVYRAYHVYIKWHWIYMELGTLLVGSLLAFWYRYPFLMMPIAFTLWYLSMDLASMIVGGRASFAFGAMVSMYFGLATLLLAFIVDVRSRKSQDYAFWLYLFGVIAFWCGMSCQSSTSELAKFIYLCINLLMMGVGVVLYRKVFVIFGALGVSIYLGHLASHVFKDSLLFPLALSAIGMLIIYLGIIWQKHEAIITQKIRALLPTAIQELLQARYD
jgi:hypothetical protein